MTCFLFFSLLSNRVNATDAVSPFRMYLTSLANKMTRDMLLPLTIC